MYKINNKNLQILILDTRTFRDSLMLSDDIGALGKKDICQIQIVINNPWN